MSRKNEPCKPIEDVAAEAPITGAAGMPTWQTKKRIVVPEDMSDKEFLEELQLIIRLRRNHVLGEGLNSEYRYNTLNTLANVVDAVIPGFCQAETS